MRKISNKLKASLAFAALMMVSGAASAGGFGQMAQTITAAFTDYASMITGAFFVAGLAIAGLAFMKFKAYNDNPQQTPLKTPVILLFVAIALVTLPGFITTGQDTVGVNDSGAVDGFDSF